MVDLRTRQTRLTLRRCLSSVKFEKLPFLHDYTANLSTDSLYCRALGVRVKVDDVRSSWRIGRIKEENFSTNYSSGTNLFNPFGTNVIIYTKVF